jgi:hypothetical protein
MLYRQVDYWENEAPENQRERLRKVTKSSTVNIVKRAKEESGK